MNKNDPFLLDAMLAPGDARHACASLRAWLDRGGDGLLEIAPVPPAPALPTQPALQLLLATAGELDRRSPGMPRLGDEARRLAALAAFPDPLPPYRSA